MATDINWFPQSPVKSPAFLSLLFAALIVLTNGFVFNTNNSFVRPSQGLYHIHITTANFATECET